MADYKVIITDILQKAVSVDADCKSEAMKRAMNNYGTGKFKLTYKNHKQTSFSAEEHFKTDKVIVNRSESSGYVHIDELVSLAEIALLMKCSPAAVSNRRYANSDFPEPVVKLKSVKLYRVKDIVEYCVSHNIDWDITLVSKNYRYIGEEV